MFGSAMTPMVVLGIQACKSEIIRWNLTKFVFRRYTEYLGKVKKFESLILKYDCETSKKSCIGSQMTHLGNSSVNSISNFTKS